MGKRRHEESAEPTKQRGVEDRSFMDSPHIEESSLVSLDDLKHELIVPGPDFREQLRDPNSQAHEPSVSELEELDHIVVNAAYQIEQMLTKFQWLRAVDVTEVGQNPAAHPLVRSLLGRHRVRLACALVQQYWDTGVPVFDDLIYTRRPHSLTALPQVRSGNLSPARLDELQALVLQAAVNSIRVMKQRVRGDNEFLSQTSRVVHKLKLSTKKRRKHSGSDGETSGADPQETDEDKRVHEADASQAKGANQVGGDEGCFPDHERRASTEPEDVKPDGGLATAWPPPLPEIDDAALLQQVFTHRSSIVDAAMSSPADLLNIHNERLEFKGDSVLDFIVCDILYTAFPAASEGSLSIMKSSLVCNDTLFDLSVAYKLHERIKVSSDLHAKIFGPGVPVTNQSVAPDATNKNKAVADVFEAYIAGVAINKGLMVVQKWLRKLYQPLILSIQHRAQHTAVAEVNKNAKNELYRKIGSADQSISYDALNDTSPFTVVCRVNGTELGRGTDRTVKVAGLRAAEAVLKQPGIVEAYAAKRRSIPKTAPVTGH